MEPTRRSDRPRTGSLEDQSARPGALAVLATAQLVLALDYSIVNVALPSIGGSLHFSGDAVEWVVTAHALMFGGFMLLGGRAADLLGRRRVFMAAGTVFGLGSFLGGFAVNPAMLLSSRALQGIAGAFLFPATLSLVTTSFAEGAPRNRAIGVWSATGAGGLAAGVFVGGMLTTTLGWRWVFFVNVPVLAVLVLAAPSVLPGVRPPRPSVHQFDVPGAVTVTAGAMLVVLSFAEATTLGWTAPGTWAPAVAGIALLGAFLAIESRSTSPLMPLWLARRRTLWGAMLVTAAFMASFGMQFFFLTMYLQSALHQSPLAAGVSVLPLATGVFIGTNAGGRLATRFGFRRVLPVAFVVGAAGLFAYTFVSPARPLTVLLVLEVVTGLGQGVSFSTAYVAAGSGVEPSRAGVASAMASTAQQLGGSVGLALLVDLLSAKLPGSHAGTFRLDRSPIPGLVPALHWVFAAQGAIALTGALVAVVVIGRAAPGEAMAEHAPAATAAPIHDERSSSDALREAG